MASYRYERDIDPKDLQPRKQRRKEYIKPHIYIIHINCRIVNMRWN